MRMVINKFQNYQSTKQKMLIEFEDFANTIRTKRRLWIQRKIIDYCDSLTIHGLTRSIKGRKAESTFWVTILLVGLFCVFVVIYGLIKKYRSHFVYTELKSTITDRNYFPSITICEDSLLKDSYFSYCGKPLTIKQDAKECYVRQYEEANITDTIDSLFWSNGFFNVTQCSAWGGKRCNGRRYLQSKRRVNNTCITWNYKGDFYDSYGHVDIQFAFYKPMWMTREVQLFAIPHDPGILEIDLTKKMEVDSEHNYEIKIDKTIIRRLPDPFPSNCTNDLSGNIFPGRYTRSSCIESHYYIEMYKECGDVFDYHKPYIPKRYHVQNRDSPNKTFQCLLNFTKTEVKDVQECNFACETLDVHYVSTSQIRHGRKRKNGSLMYQFELGLQLNTANEYKVMEEKQLYTLSQLVCEIGGFVGLIMGMSVISIVEVIVILILTIAKKLV